MCTEGFLIYFRLAQKDGGMVTMSNELLQKAEAVSDSWGKRNE